MMAESRPDPDALLAQVKAEEARARRGKLRIFFGATAGVGKTFAMLSAAHAVRLTTEVVVGYVEPHGRAQTEGLIAGLERLPTLPVDYRGIVRQEFDLDAALKRRPTILLVDELAHSNLVGGEPPPRHPKRWQDIEELLEAGINVWTTLNVQHLESLNDVVAQITGVRQRETLPDRIFDTADEIELIDLPPDDLLARLHAGKVYVPEEIGTAVERFFRKPNLIALRELALRRMTDRVEAAARASLAGDRTSREWLAQDHLLVAIGPDQQAEQLVRAGKRMADALRSPVDRRVRRDARVAAAFGRSSAIGASTCCDSPSRSAPRPSRSTGPRRPRRSPSTRTRARATRVIVGAPKRRGWRALLAPLDGGRARAARAGLRRRDRGGARRGASRTAQRASCAGHGRAGARAGALEALRRGDWRSRRSAPRSRALMFPYFELSNIVMIYLLGVVVASLRIGRLPSVLTAVLNVICLDFFFVAPQFTFAVSDAQYVVTFGVMLTIALVIATLTASVRQQTRVAGARERRTALLYAMSRELAATRDIASMARLAVRHVAEVFESDAVVLLPNDAGRLRYPTEAPSDSAFRGADLAIAQWVADHGRRAGLGSDTLPAAPALYLPLGDAGRGLGVLAVRPRNPRRVLLPEQRHLLETFAGQIGARAGARAARRTRPQVRASRPSARRCATRCSRRSRTTCARRSR